MLAIGSYFAFIIFVMGTMSVAQDISEEQEKKFIQDILRAHNKYRFKHASGDLKLDDELCKIAKERALGMKTSTYNFLPEEYEISYSETKCDSFSDVDPFKIVETWYEKGKSYDYKHGSSDQSADKFTNIVWSSTKIIGAGISISDNICYVAVVYFTVNKYEGQSSSNVIDPNKAAVLNQKKITSVFDDKKKKKK